MNELDLFINVIKFVIISIIYVLKIISHFFKPPKPDDLATICYTSGTTGVPKGKKKKFKLFLNYKI